MEIFEFFDLVPPVLVFSNFFNPLVENKSMSSIGTVISTNNAPGVRWHMVESQVCLACYGVMRHLPYEDLDLWRNFEVPYPCLNLIH